VTTRRVDLGAVLATVILLSAATGLAMLGAAWSRERSQRWDEPRWDPRQMVPVRASFARERAREIWVVPVNPRCPHCAGHLIAAATARGLEHGVRLEVLIVDTPKPPAAETLVRMEADGWWWDARETWRRRWGHRVYGERIVFDGSGRYRRTEPPAGAPAPP
jgi:hypothetical protein